MAHPTPYPRCGTRNPRIGSARRGAGARVCLMPQPAICNLTKTPPMGFAAPSMLAREDYNVALNPRYPFLGKRLTTTITRFCV
jgi:hypothetical protein